MAVDPLTLYAFAAEALECARAEVAKTGGGIEDGMRVCVVPAPVVADDCRCGQLSVAVTRAFSSTAFPNQETGRTVCGHGLTVVELTVQVIRCAPQGKGTSPPTCEQLDAAARLVARDGYAVRRGLLCCMTGWRDKIVGATVFDTRGDCMGSSTTLTVGVADGCACGDAG